MDYTVSMFQAIAHQQIDRMRLLLQCPHADVNVVVRDETALYALVSTNYCDEGQWLLMFALLVKHGADPFQVRAVDNVSLIWRAAERGNVVALQHLWRITPEDQLAKLTVRSSTGASALRVAAQNGYVDAVAFLIEKKLDPNNTTPDGMTPLLSAANNPRNCFYKDLDFFKICKLLLRAGANPFHEFEGANAFRFVDEHNFRVVRLFEREERVLTALRALVAAGDFATILRFVKREKNWVSNPNLWVPTVRTPTTHFFFRELATLMMEEVVNGKFTPKCYLAQFVPLFLGENLFLQRLKQAHLAQYAIFSAFCNETCDEETGDQTEYDGPILEALVESGVYPEQRQRKFVKQAFAVYF
jgi:hypothetical protein